jgi:cellulose synthase/poly-beta-1,6-N-acetylglucosamine synthase-like glycosyltransferase
MDFLQPLVQAAFWFCLAAVFYAYFGYPLLIWCLARCFGRREQDTADECGEWATVSLLIAAHNEATVIGERLRNALALDYPAEKLQIVVASDGSEDGTTEIVQGYAERGVVLFDYPQRRGKATALNDSFKDLWGDIVVLSDANTFTDAAAVRKLVRWFRDPEVGVVCGRLVLADPVSGCNVDSYYWRYETFLKKCEGQLGALLGANGAIYAIRRALFSPIPGNTIVDDLIIPLQAKLRTNCRIVYDTEAVAREETPPHFGAEFHRRSRIGAGGFQSIGMLWSLLDPRKGWVAFTFFSHKILRWLGPFFLVGAFAANLALACSEMMTTSTMGLYGNLLVGQVAFYVTSLLAAFVPARIRLLKPLRLTTMFTAMNAALLVGFCRWLLGSQKGTWNRTARFVEVERAVR